MVWDFTQGTAGQLVFTPLCLGPQLQDLKAGTWNHMKACSFTSLTFDSGCQLRPQLRAVGQEHIHMVSPRGLCFCTTWHLCSKSGQAYNLDLKAMQHHVCHSVGQSSCKHTSNFNGEFILSMSYDHIYWCNHIYKTQFARVPDPSEITPQVAPK